MKRGNTRGGEERRRSKETDPSDAPAWLSCKFPALNPPSLPRANQAATTAPNRSVSSVVGSRARRIHTQRAPGSTSRRVTIGGSSLALRRSC